MAGEAVEQGNLRKQTAVEQIEWRQTIDAKSSPFPPPRPFPPPPPTTHPTNCSKHFPQTFFQCFYSASNKLWFRSMAIPSWFHQFSVTLDGGNGLIWFPHFSTQPPTHTYTSPPSLTLQYPISVHRPLQKKPVQQRIFSQNPGLLCHSHVWLCHSQ